jgi:hypothetical protein
LDTHVAIGLLATPSRDAVWSRILALGDGIERMPVAERWSAKPLRSMATTIESAAARLDELDDEGLDDEP